MNSEDTSYVGFVNLSNIVHRKSLKKGFEFTLMVVGEAGLGKSTLINSLFCTDLYPDRVVPGVVEKTQQIVKIEASTVEIDEKGVKLRLTVIDTPGFGDSINNSQHHIPIIKYIDQQLNNCLESETSVYRRNYVDTRVHCCLFFISPFGRGLKPLDIEVMKALHQKVNLVPVIAKSDTLTKSEVADLKKQVLEQIKKHDIHIYQLPDPDEEEDEVFKQGIADLKANMPFAVCGSTGLFDVKGSKVRGRDYPWGVVVLENPEHCDFSRLRNLLTWQMQDFIELTNTVHYENYRTEFLINRQKGDTRFAYEVGSLLPNKEYALLEKEKEVKRLRDMLAKLQGEENVLVQEQKSQTENLGR